MPGRIGTLHTLQGPQIPSLGSRPWVPTQATLDQQAIEEHLANNKGLKKRGNRNGAHLGRDVRYDTGRGTRTPVEQLSHQFLPLVNRSYFGYAEGASFEQQGNQLQSHFQSQPSVNDPSYVEATAPSVEQDGNQPQPALDNNDDACPCALCFSSQLREQGYHVHSPLQSATVGVTEEHSAENQGCYAARAHQLLHFHQKNGFHPGCAECSQLEQQGYYPACAECLLLAQRKGQYPGHAQCPLLQQQSAQRQASNYSGEPSAIQETSPPIFQRPTARPIEIRNPITGAVQQFPPRPSPPSAPPVPPPPAPPTCSVPGPSTPLPPLSQNDPPIRQNSKPFPYGTGETLILNRVVGGRVWVKPGLARPTPQGPRQGPSLFLAQKLEERSVIPSKPLEESRHEKWLADARAFSTSMRRPGLVEAWLMEEFDGWLD